MKSTTQRFWEKVDKNGPVHSTSGTPCWLWLGKLDKDGYGTFHVLRIDDKPVRCKAHNFLVQSPKGLVPDHLCRNRACVNPEHIEHVTERDNILRGTGFAAVNAAKTVCKNGHPFNEENTWHHLDRGKMRRTCRACARTRAAKWSQANRAHIKAYDKKRWELGLTFAQRSKQ